MAHKSLAQLCSIVKKCRGAYSEKDFGKARIYAAKAVDILFFRDKSKCMLQGLFFDQLPSLNQRDATLLVSNAVRAADLYSILNECHEDCLEVRRLKRIRELFPYNLITNWVLNNSRVSSCDESFNHYGSEQLVSCDDGNLAGRTNEQPSTFVDFFISYQGAVPRKHARQYMRVAAYILGSQRTNLDEIVGQKSKDMIAVKRGVYESVIGGIKKQIRVWIADETEKLNGEKAQRNALLRAKREYERHQKTVCEFAEGLPKLIEDDGYRELVELIASVPGTDYLAGFSHFKRRLRAVNDELDRFLKDVEINETYRNREEVMQGLRKWKVDLQGDEGFFERLKDVIRSGERLKGTAGGKYIERQGIRVCCKSLDEAINCARWDLKDEFLLLSPIGRGGFMSVYLGVMCGNKEYDENDFVAIKVVNPTERVRRICRKTGWDIDNRREDVPRRILIHHQNVAICSRHYHQGIMLYFEEDLVYNTLEGKVKESGPLGNDEAKKMLQHVASGLSACQRRKLIHQDIKPDNIGHRDGDYMLIDFGIARYLGEAVEKHNVGSLLTMAPELYPKKETKHCKKEPKKKNEPSFESDIYSLGVTLFFACLAKYPHEVPPKPLALSFMPGGGRTKCEYKLSKLRRSCNFYDKVIKYFKENINDPALVRIVSKCLQRNPKDRYHSAEELIQDMDKD